MDRIREEISRTNDLLPHVVVDSKTIEDAIISVFRFPGLSGKLTRLSGKFIFTNDGFKKFVLMERK